MKLPSAHPGGTHLFLLPHQDDETPVLLEIERLARAGEPLCIVYLTTGQRNGNACPVRNRESLEVLATLGVPSESLWFLGAELQIPDGQLQMHLSPAWESLQRRFSDTPPQSLHMPAWEGGHQDHDAAHLLAVTLAQQWGRLQESWQFPYYHGHKLIGILFKVLDPLAANGAAISDPIPFATRWRYLRLLLNYKSQRLSWVGLGPFFALHYAFYGTQVRQPVSVARLGEKPHPGAMLYERRSFSSYPDFEAATLEFRQQYLS